jgi:hypothetical protein
MKTLARERDKAEILQRLRGLRPDTSRRWGRMSAPQMVCHLSDGYRLLTGELMPAPIATPLPRPVVKWVALYAPMKWPRGLPTIPEADQMLGGTPPGLFDRDLAALTALVDHIAGARRGTLERRPHPIFGRMSEADWLRWGYLHADHHLRQFGL